MRADILELMADEILGCPVGKLASFVAMDDGKPRLDGMSKGRLREVHRADRDTWLAEKRGTTEVKRLLKLRARRRRPEVYRVATATYYAAHKDRLDTVAKAYRLAHKAEQAARSRASYLAHKEIVKARSNARYYARKAKP